MTADRAIIRRTRLVSCGLMLFLMLNALGMSGIIWIVSPAGYKETVLKHSWDLLQGQGGDDSWGVMHVALGQVQAFPATPLYSELFFRRQFRFQYPPSSLLALEALRLAGPERVRTMDGVIYPGWPPVNDLVGWLFVLMTAAATATLLELALRANKVVTHQAGWTAVRVLAVAGLTLTFYPVVKAFTLGQIQVWINGLLALSLLCWVLQRRALGGVLIGITCLIKPHYGLFLLWAALRREWGFVVAGALTVSAGLVGSVALYGWLNHLDYLRVLSFLSQHGEAYYPNQSINGLLNRLMSIANPALYINLELRAGQFPPFTLWIYGATLASSLALLAGGIFWRRDGEPRAWDFSRMALSCTMASPIAWEHHYGILLPVFAFVFASDPGNRPRVVWLAVSYMLISNFVPAVNLLAPMWFNPAQSHVLAGAIIMLVILYRGPRVDRIAAAPPLAAGAVGMRPSGFRGGGSGM